MGHISIFPPSSVCEETKCTETYTAGTDVLLVAVPWPRAVFRGWSRGDCISMAPACRVRILSNTTITASFLYVGRPLVGATVATTVAAGGWVPVKVKCPTPQTRCNGTVRLTAAVRSRAKHVVSVGSARFSVAGGKAAAVRVKVSRAALALLRSGGSLPVKATFVTSNPQGERATEVRELVLRLARPQRPTRADR